MTLAIGGDLNSAKLLLGIAHPQPKKEAGKKGSRIRSVARGLAAEPEWHEPVRKAGAAIETVRREPEGLFAMAQLKKEETRMKLTNHEMVRRRYRRMGLFLIWDVLIWLAVGWMADAQAVSTTTVQGTVYLANGQPGAGTLVVSWPAFTTANGQAVAADSTTVTIAPDGFVSVNLAPNLGATPAGLYYTAVYYLSDGTTNTQYWVVPAAAQATLGRCRRS
jgi:hypothetical protein